MPDVALRAQLACARRELARRVRRYERGCGLPPMRPTPGGRVTAQEELAGMLAIVRTLQGLVEGATRGEDGQGELWGEREEGVNEHGTV